MFLRKIGANVSAVLIKEESNVIRNVWRRNRGHQAHQKSKHTLQYLIPLLVISNCVLNDFEGLLCTFMTMCVCVGKMVSDICSECVLSVILIHAHLPCHLCWPEISLDYQNYLRFCVLLSNPLQLPACLDVMFLF